MDLRSYVAIIRKYLPLILVASLVGLGLGGLKYAITPKQYTASVDFYVSTPIEKGTNPSSAQDFAVGRLTTYEGLLTSNELGQRVAEAQGLSLKPSAVAQKVTATSSVGSVIVSATVTDTDRERALQIAQGLQKTFPTLVDELDNAGRTTPVVSVKTLSAPLGSQFPVAPKLPLNLATGLLGGLALGILVALVREAFASVRPTVVKSSDLPPTA